MWYFLCIDDSAKAKWCSGECAVKVNIQAEFRRNAVKLKLNFFTFDHMAVGLPILHTHAACNIQLLPFELKPVKTPFLLILSMLHPTSCTHLSREHIFHNTTPTFLPPTRTQTALHCSSCCRHSCIRAILYENDKIFKVLLHCNVTWKRENCTIPTSAYSHATCLGAHACTRASCVLHTFSVHTSTLSHPFYQFKLCPLHVC